MINSSTILIIQFFHIYGVGMFQRRIGKSIETLKKDMYLGTYLEHLNLNQRHCCIGFLFIFIEVQISQKLDYDLVFYNICNSKKVIVPKYNLTNNIGFSAENTHTKDSFKKRMLLIITKAE